MSPLPFFFLKTQLSLILLEPKTFLLPIPKARSRFDLQGNSSRYASASDSQTFPLSAQNQKKPPLNGFVELGALFSQKKKKTL
jgi:hypothetical protein